jgi:hypothetical protein
MIIKTKLLNRDDQYFHFTGHDTKKNIFLILTRYTYTSLVMRLKKLVT